MSNKFKVIIFIFFISLFIYFCWYAYFVKIDPLKEHEIPILKAQSEIKASPSTPGGVEISNKDKSIYNHMLGKKKTDKHVRVIENDEKPVSKLALEELVNKQLKRNFPKSSLDSYSSNENTKKQVNKSNNLDVKYSIRVAKLKEKRFVLQGIEIFHKKYPFLKSTRGELVSKNGNYFLHFSDISSKKEALMMCRKISDGGGKCSVYTQ